MTIPTTPLDRLRRDEGYRPHPYFDCCGKPFRECRCKKQGKLTVGIGRNLEDTPLTLAEAEYLATNDDVRASAAVLARIPFSHRLDDVRRRVLVEMAYNLGIGGLLEFRKALEAMERGDWSAAAAEMLDSLWAKQVGVRAERLAEMMVSGEWR